MPQKDDTIDQILENARMLYSIQNNPRFALERKALEDIQESLYHHLLTLEVSEEKQCEIKKVVRSKGESIFLAPKKTLRRSRMKQALEQH
jgi:hypothetical protein